MALRINITIPGDGQLLIPLWRALEAQAALNMAVHGSTENCAVLNFVAQQFREAFPAECLGVMGATASWENAWRGSDKL